MKGIAYTKDKVVGQAVFARNHIDEPMTEGEIDIEVVEPDSCSHLNPRIPTVVVLPVAKLIRTLTSLFRLPLSTYGAQEMAKW